MTYSGDDVAHWGNASSSCAHGIMRSWREDRVVIGGARVVCL